MGEVEPRYLDELDDDVLGHVIALTPVAARVNLARCSRRYRGAAFAAEPQGSVWRCGNCTCCQFVPSLRHVVLPPPPEDEEPEPSYWVFLFPPSRESTVLGLLEALETEGLQAYGRQLKPPVLVRACLDAEHEDLVEACRPASVALTFDRGTCSFKFTLEEQDLELPLVPMLSTGARRVDGAAQYVRTVLLPRLHVLGVLDALFDAPAADWACSSRSAAAREEEERTAKEEEESQYHPFAWQGAHSGVWAHEYKAARPDRTQALTDELQRLRTSARAEGITPPACIQRPSLASITTQLPPLPSTRADALAPDNANAGSSPPLPPSSSLRDVASSPRSLGSGGIL